MARFIINRRKKTFPKPAGTGLQRRSGDVPGGSNRLADCYTIEPQKFGIGNIEKETVQNVS